MPQLGKSSPAENRDLARRDRDRDRSLAPSDWFGARDPFAEAFRRFDDAFAAWPFVSGSLVGGASTSWRPQIEAFQHGDEFVVRADLPGLEKKDVTVEVQDDTLIITGERTDQRQQDGRGYYSSERRYGRFCRVVPLPDGAIADSVKAQFKNGVLEVVTTVPPHETARGRRIDIG